MTESASTYALLVGIESYSGGWDLDGPANDVYRLTRWLKDNNVLSENISVLLSPLVKNTDISEQVTSIIGRKPKAATQVEINRAFEELQKVDAGLLFCYWSGHGWITPEGERLLYCSDASDTDRKNLDLMAQLTAMRSDLYSGLSRQIFVVDTCANYIRYLENTPSKYKPAVGSALTSLEQFALFAANLVTMP